MYVRSGQPRRFGRRRSLSDRKVSSPSLSKTSRWLEGSSTCHVIAELGVRVPTEAGRMLPTGLVGRERFRVVAHPQRERRILRGPPRHGERRSRRFWATVASGGAAPRSVQRQYLPHGSVVRSHRAVPTNACVPPSARAVTRMRPDHRSHRRATHRLGHWTRCADGLLHEHSGPELRGPPRTDDRARCTCVTDREYEHVRTIECARLRHSLLEHDARGGRTLSARSAVCAHSPARPTEHGFTAGRRDVGARAAAG